MCVRAIIIQKLVFISSNQNFKMLATSFYTEVTYVHMKEPIVLCAYERVHTCI